MVFVLFYVYQIVTMAASALLRFLNSTIFSMLISVCQRHIYLINNWDIPGCLITWGDAGRDRVLGLADVSYHGRFDIYTAAIKGLV